MLPPLLCYDLEKVRGLMAKQSSNSVNSLPELLPFDEKHYKDLRRKNVIRLLLTYLAPLILIIIFFYYQYRGLLDESQRLHLQAIAENQANTIDLFLEERLVNIGNVINDPKFQLPITSEYLQSALDRLKTESGAFIDIGYFDPSGIQAAYVGPHPFLERRNYSSESWYIRLSDKEDDFIITDIYLGFRQRPHFTIAVRRIIENKYIVLRATLDPGKIYEYITSLKGSNEVVTSIVNKEGLYQVVTPESDVLKASSIIPPQNPPLGVSEARSKDGSAIYAYSWLRTAEWALIVQESAVSGGSVLSSFEFRLIVLSLVITVILLSLIIHRAKRLVEFQRESDQTRVQLEHASKLASIGELASGIAHEINNPLAVISEKAGLMQDLMNPQYGLKIDEDEFNNHLGKIQEAVFRCRNITRKLLSFVRQSDIDLKPRDINKVIGGVVDDLLGQELAVSNIKLVKDYGLDIPRIVTDGNQLQQVLLNILNNAIDALEGKPGKIKVKTYMENNSLYIDISDTGKGIRSDQIPRLFMPFYTTKEVGKGTGLGLSVSYGIIKNLGGTISVQSKVGKGSTFTIELPVQ
jgi:two-component system NtrC family sensor kinase